MSKGVAKGDKRTPMKQRGMGTHKIVNHKMMDPKDVQRLLDDAWLNLDVRDEDIYNPLEIIPRAFDEDPHIFLTWMLSNPYYLYMFCKEILNVTIFPTQALIMQELWTHKFPILLGSRGLSKTFTIALYALLRCILMQGRKAVVVGSSFRQSKIVFEYIEQIWRNAPLLRDMIGQGKRDDQIIKHDSSMWTFILQDSRINCCPLGDGTTIRGLRSNDTYADEMASINEHIFENVVAGFGIVSSGPVDNIKKESAKRMREKLGMEPEVDNLEDIKTNQVVLSGTCYYQFNHFYRYFTKYRDIIRSRGDTNKLKELVGDEVYNPHFNWKDYSIIRIPYNLLPEGYFDAAQLSRNKLNTLPSNFLAEYGACFPADSDGFFKRSLINQCIASTYTPIIINEKPVGFLPTLEGNPHSKYVYGLDPASEADNLAIVILELFEDHKRIVYSWTTNKFKHQKQLKTQNTHEHNYWAYCCRKLRSLMKTFPPLLIAIDSQGGGNAVRESLADNDKLQQGETPLYPIPDPAKPLFSDTQEGKHILKMCNFADNKWLSNAYFDTKKDFTDRVLLFPSFDDASIGIAQTGMENEEIVIEGGLEDTMDGLLQEIEELKNELTCIMHMKNPSGGDKFTVPDMKSAEGKKLKVRKDRASALIMANSMARVIQRDTHTLEYESNGGFSQPSKSEGMLFANNAYFGKQLSEAYSIY